MDLRNPPPLEGPAIRNLFDLDFYDEPIGGYVFKHHPDVDVTMGFINRHTKFPIADIVAEEDLVRDLSSVQALKTRNTDIYTMRGMDCYGDRLFPEPYIEHWKNLKMSPFTVKRVGTQYDIRFQGKWLNTMNWELYLLPILCHLIHAEVEKNMTQAERVEFYRRADAKVVAKLKRLAEVPSIRMSDFGHRRRYSFDWQSHVLDRCAEILRNQFLGTSNVYMAYHHDMVPMGTIAHQIFMVAAALASVYGEEAMWEALYRVLIRWAQMYPYALRILLPDTYGSRGFFDNMPPDIARFVAENYRGGRGDSGESLIEEGQILIDWFKKWGADPKKKLYIPSDGLDVDPILEIHKALYGSIELSYGVGTNLMADMRGCHPRGHEEAVIRGKRLGITWDELVTPHSFICKPFTANGIPCFKMSNNFEKKTDPGNVFDLYGKVFGTKGVGSQKVFV